MRIKLLLVFLSVTSLALSQTSKEFKIENFPGKALNLKAALEELKAGDKMFDYGYYRAALGHYLKANDFNPDNAHLNYKIGSCYLSTRVFKKSLAVPYIEKAFKLDPKVMPDIHFQLARCYHLNLQWSQAIEAYQTELKRPGLREQNINEIKKRIQECEYGKYYVEKPAKAKVISISNNINSKFSDYSPVISADGEMMYFTSRREESTGGVRDDDGEYFEDIYYSQLVNGEWTPAKNLGAPINTTNHDAIIGLSPDGQRMFVYVNEEGDGNIYQCRLNGDRWSKPEPLPKPINTIHHESSASISYDGNTICWVSDRPGGLGGTDIYMSSRTKEGKWGEAMNLGAQINTPLNELGVFLLADGKTMYFSSEGHSSMGGMDIFKTVLENGKWSTPENIGYPINTPDNDIFFVVSANGVSGYYSSIREGGTGEVDIYQFELLPDQPTQVATAEQPKTPEATAQVTLVKGIITDSESGVPVEARVQMVDNSRNEVIADGYSNSKTGKYLYTLPSGKNYAVVVKKNDYLFHSENFDLAEGQGYQEIKKDIQLKKIAVGNKIVLNNIFFEYNKGTLSEASFHELDNLVTLLKDSGTLRIEISGHTDGKGSAAGNLTLSQERANSVVGYLVGKGISTDRLVAKGYGLTKPIASNDSEEGRKLNRRTEFEILSK